MFPDETTAVAAVDRLVHHATIFEMNVESYRRRAAVAQKKKGPDAPPRSPPKRIPTRTPRAPDRTRYISRSPRGVAPASRAALFPPHKPRTQTDAPAEISVIVAHPFTPS